MTLGKFVSYLRVSTDRQGKSGLGLEAQRSSVAAFLNDGRRSLLSEHVEIESGKIANRPKLTEAIKVCRVYGATLLIAKLDRLSRDAHFLLGLEKAGVEFLCADMPNANRLTVGIMAMVAEEERRMISQRTKDALASAKARGIKLGGNRISSLTGAAPTFSPDVRAAGLTARRKCAIRRASDLFATIEAIRSEGKKSAGAIARELVARGIPTSRGRDLWQAVQVQRLLVLMR